MAAPAGSSSSSSGRVGLRSDSGKGGDSKSASSDSKSGGASKAGDSQSSGGGAADEGGDDEGGSGGASDSGSGGSGGGEEEKGGGEGKAGGKANVGNANLVVDTSHVSAPAPKVDTVITSSGNSSLWSGEGDGLGGVPGVRSLRLLAAGD